MTQMTAERLWDVARVGEPHALPDGRLLIPVTTTDGNTERSETTLWRLDPETGDRHALASGRISSPSVAPDGSSIAFLRPVGDHRQVHVLPLDGGEAKAITDLPRGAVGAKWTPDGRIIALAALLADHPTLEATAAHEPDEHLQVRTTESAIYRFWDTWLDEVYHPVIVEPTTGDVTDLTPGATRFWSFPNVGSPIDDIDVSPDSSLVVFAADDSEAPHRVLCWSLFSVGVDGSGLRRLDPDKDGNVSRPRFTFDGSAIVYGYQVEADYYASPTRLVRRTLGTDEETILADGWDRDPSGWRLDGRGRLLFAAEDRGTSRLWRIGSVDAEPEPLTSGGWVTGPTVDSSGVVYVSRQSLREPAEIYRVGTPGPDGIHELDRVTDFTGESFASIETGIVREFEVTGGDDEPIQVLVVDPPGAEPDAPLPLVHMIHGGPHGAFGDTWHARWNAQIIAAAGYRVAHVNFHGSTGWGDAFTRSIHGAWGDLPYRDVEAATDHLIGLGLVDERRMAITGGSYGGYLTAWIASQTDRYACAVAHAAVTNLGGMYASDVTGGRVRSYGGEIWDNRAAIERWSPSAHAAGYSTPTLVIHGHRDERVPVTQGLEFYGVLVAKGVPARLVSFPEENHWIVSRSNSIRWYDEFLAWLDRWMSTS